MKPSLALRSLLLGSAISLMFTAPTAFALPYTWTQNSVATQTWTTAGNWLSSSQYVSDPANELKFFEDITTALANGINAITTSVPTTLSMNILTLNGLGTSTTSGTSTINIASNSSTWTLDGSSPTVNLNGVNNGIKLLNYNIAAKLTLAQATTVFTGNGTAGFNFSGVISGSSKAITKSGTSTLTLSGANTYSGATTISGGTLSLNHADAIKNSASVSVASGATLRMILAGSPTYTNTNTVTIAGTGVGSNNGALRFQASSVWAAPIDLTATSTLYSFGAAVSTTLNGAITGTGNLTFASRGGVGTHTAVWTLNAAVGHSGTTSIVNDAGLKDITVKLGLANALPIGTSLNLSTTNNSVSGATAFATLDLNGRDQELAGLTDTGGIVVNTGAGNTSNKRVINSSATLATLKINNAGNITYGTTGTEITAGTIGGTTAAEVAANNLALTKTGVGTLTLAGANTYTGKTSVSNGTLLVNGTHLESSAVMGNGYGSSATGHYEVESNATLGGTGRIAGNTSDASSNMLLVKSGGVLAPGANGIGILKLDGANIGGAGSAVLNMASGSIFKWDLSGSSGTSDQIEFWNYNSGDFGLNTNAVNLTLTGTEAAGSYTATLFKFYSDSGTALMASGISSGLTIGSLTGSFSGTPTFDYSTTGEIRLNYSVVPEPTSALAGLLLTAGLLRRRRATHVSADSPQLRCKKDVG